MPLPIEKTPADFDLSKQTVLIYGPPGIGKSTFASQFPDVLFLATEEGLRGIECYQIPIGSWAQLQQAYEEILADQKSKNPRFKTICIDTIDVAYLYLEKVICDQYNARAINDDKSSLTWGTGYSIAKNRIRAVIMAFGQLPCGLILTSHSKSREYKSRTGDFIKQVPSMPDAVCREVIIPMTDIVLYCEIETEYDRDGKFVKDVRAIKTAPNKFYEAKDRTGRLPAELPLDYDKFIEAYNRTTKAPEAPKETDDARLI